LANDSRSADVVAICGGVPLNTPFRLVSSLCSAQGLQRRLAVHRFVGGCEPAEVGEPPAVRDRGDLS